MGVAAVAIGKQLYDIGDEFEKANNRIRAGTGKTGDALESLEQSFKNVVSDVPASFEEVSEALTDTEQRLGLMGKPLEARTKQFIELSRITETDVTGNIKAVGRAFEDAAIPVGKQGEKLDELFRASQKSGASVEELATLMAKFGSPLRQLGIGFNESLSYFAEFEKAGVNIQTMMPGLRQALKKFYEEGRDPGNALQNTFKGIESGSIGMSKALEIFGTRAGPDMVEAVDQGRFHLEGFEKSIVSGKSSIMKVGAETRTTSDNLQILGNKVKVLVAPAAEWLTKAVNAVAKAFVTMNFKPILRDLGLSQQDIKQVGQALEHVGSFLSKVFGPVVKNSISGAEKFFSGFGQTIKGIVKTVSAIINGEWSKAWTDLKETAKGALKAVVGEIEVFSAPLRRGAELMGKGLVEGFEWTFNAVEGVVVGGVNDVIGFIDKLASVLEAIPGVPSIQIPEINVEQAGSNRGSVSVGKKHSSKAGYARGGSLANLGAPVGDTIPAMLERDEYVLNRNAVSVIGKQNLDAINFGAAPRFASGGLFGTGIDFNPAHDVGVAAGAAKNLIGKGLGTVGAALGALPTPHLPSWMGGLGSWVIEQVSNYISNGFSSGKLGDKTPSGSGVINQMAAKYGVPAKILWGIYGAESTFGTNGEYLFGGIDLPHGNTKNLSVAAREAAKAMARLYKSTGSWEGAMRAYSGGEYGLAHAYELAATKGYAQGGSVQLHGPPLFHGEGPPYYAAALKHNQPFATHNAPWSTHLSSSDERSFLKWGKNIDGHGHGLSWFGFDPKRQRNDYDMRGFWKQTGGKGPAANGHFTDTFKTPYDTTFSSESKYAVPGTPYVWSKNWKWLYDRRSGQIISSGKYASGGSVKGSAGRAVQWAKNNIGAGVSKQDKWDSLAGFGPGTEWCGIFLGADMKAQGLPVPSDYASAANWASYGTAASRSDIKPGDILVYGGAHVAMAISSSEQIQGNDENGTVGTSGIGGTIGGSGLTAVRRPKWKAGSATSSKSGSSATSSAKPALGEAESILHREGMGVSTGTALSVDPLKAGKVTGAAKGLQKRFRNALKAPGLKFAQKLNIAEQALSFAEEHEESTTAADAYGKELESGNVKRLAGKLKHIDAELKKPNKPAQRKRLLKERESVESNLGSARESLSSFNSASGGEEVETEAQQKAREATEANTEAVEAEQKAVEEAKQVEEERKAVEEQQTEAIKELNGTVAEQTRMANEGAQLNAAVVMKYMADQASGLIGARTTLQTSMPGAGSPGTY